MTQEKTNDEKEKALQQTVQNILRNRRLATIQRFVYDCSEYDLLSIMRELGRQLYGARFAIDKDNRFVYENTVRWLIGHQFEAIDPKSGNTIQGDFGRGLYIAGNCGSGKSVLLQLLAAIAGNYHTEYEFDGRKIALCWSEKRADELCNDFVLNGADVVANAKMADILCLNDLGSEPAEQLYMGNRVNIIRQIIEARGDRQGQITVITSNYPMLHPFIKERYGDRVVSRLQGMCNYFELKGKDRRTY